MTRSEITYELFINQNIRYKNFISYLNHSKDYTSQEIDSIYQSGQSRKLDLSFLLGTLILEVSNEVHQKDLIDLSKNEPEFRKKLVDSLKAKGNNEIKSILSKNKISFENIIDLEKSRSFESFSAKKFIELIVAKKDSKIVEFFSISKVIEDQELKELLGNKYK